MLKSLIDYLVGQAVKLRVRLELGKSVTSAVVQAESPDVVIVATGAVPVVPKIQGLNKCHVVTAEDVLRDSADVGERVVIIGGELVGCEVADYLAAEGKQVTVARRGPRMATTMMPVLRRLLLDRLAQMKVVMLPGIKYEEATEAGLVVTLKDGQRQIIPADTIVLAAGARANIRLAQALEGKVGQIYSVGDCVQPRGILQAIDEGFRIGLLV